MNNIALAIVALSVMLCIYAILCVIGYLRTARQLHKLNKHWSSMTYDEWLAQKEAESRDLDRILEED